MTFARFPPLELFSTKIMNVSRVVTLMRMAKANVCLVDHLSNFTVLETPGESPLDQAGAQKLLRQQLSFASRSSGHSRGGDSELAKIKHEEKRLLASSGDFDKKLECAMGPVEPDIVFSEAWENNHIMPRDAFSLLKDGHDEDSKEVQLMLAAMKETGVESFRDLSDKLSRKRVCFFRRKYNPESDSDSESDNESDNECEEWQDVVWLRRAVVPEYRGDVVGPVIIY